MAELIVYPTDDTYAYSQESALPHNVSELSAERKVDVNKHAESYLKFNIPDEDMTIVKLRLWFHKVYVEDRSEPITLFSSIDTSWTEETLTWNNKPPFDGDLDVSFNTPSSSPNWGEIDITGWAQAHRGETVTIIITTEIDYFTAKMDSKEVSNKPNLQIIYTEAPPDQAIAHLTSEPTGAFITSPTITPGSQTPYTHTKTFSYGMIVTYSLTGYEDISFQVNVSLGEEITFHKVLTPTTPPTGTGGIIGIVTDSATGLPQVNVEVNIAGKTDFTNSSGNYSIQDIDVGTYTITYKKLGYNDFSQSVTIMDGVSAERNVQMDPSVAPPDYTEWWLDLVEIQEDGTFVFKETTIAPIDLQPWLQKWYIEEPLTTAAKLAFWTVLAAAGTYTIFKVLSLAGTTIAAKIAEDAPTTIKDGFSLTEVTLTNIRDLVTTQAAATTHPGMVKLMEFLAPIFTRRVIIKAIGYTLGYSGLVAWLSSDNIITGTTFSLNRIKDLVEAGTITKAEAYAQIQMTQDWKDAATTFLQVATIVNPLLWLFRTQFINNTELAQQNIDNVKLQIDEAIVTPPAEDMGRLTINSTPSGAKIHIDSVYIFEVTNTMILVAPGDHILTLKMGGYEDYSENFTIAAAEEKTITATLTAVELGITLTINSLPPGAKIYIDDGYIWETTDTTIKAPAGLHKITLKLAGYKDHNLPYDWPVGTVKTLLVTLQLLDGGEPTVTQPADEVVIPLEPVGEPTFNSWKVTIRGTDSVTGTDVAAWILIDDVFKGVTTPAVFYLAPESAFNIKLRLSGYRQGEATYTTLPLPAA